MEGKTYVTILKDIFEVQNNNQLAKALGTTAATVGNWEKAEISRTVLKNSVNRIAKRHRNRFDGNSFIEYAKKKYKMDSDATLAKTFGVSQQNIHNWRKQGLNFLSILNLMENTKINYAASIVVPVIEYYPIALDQETKIARRKILKEGDRKQDALIQELAKNRGVYAFYDSRGVCLYVGKAVKQSLWAEMNAVYHRPPNKSQRIRKVKHLKIDRFHAGTEKKRKIENQKARLVAAANFFSAYKVGKPFIANFEAALIRIFANTLQNHKMEKFK